MPLATYRRKRDFAKTTEPRGARRPARGGLSYVIQKHAATRLHYDLRLELDGALKSWAVPKGPSLDPGQKHLAVEVEDHPLEYATFEGTIPRGEYGAGAVIVWDRGTWTPLEDPHEGLKKGRLKFELSGEKLHGAWMLVRMGGRASRDADKPQWLLIKERDTHARPGAKSSVVDRLPRSVASDRRIEDLDNPRKPAGARSRSGRRAPATRASRLDPSTIEGARKAPLPRTLAPELATLVRETPEGDRWLHEIKLDGYRALARVERGAVRMLTRSGQDWTERFAPIAAALASLPIPSALLDGEIVVLDANGISDFQRLQNALSGDPSAALVYYAFDLVHAGGYDLARVPLEERKQALAALLAGMPEDGPVRYSDHYEGSGAEFHRAACARGLEGVIAKRRDSPYRPGRGNDWLKIKCAARQELVIGGFTEPEGSRTGLGALLLGVQDGGGLRYAGRVGTGFSHAALTALRAKLGKLETQRPAFADPPRGRGIHWVRPALVAEVAFTGWTRDGRLRHPSFQGLREDKRPEDVVRERPAEAGDDPRTARARKRAPAARKGSARSPAGASPRRPASARSTASAAEKLPATPGKDGSVGGVALTNPDRVLYPDEKLTKRDLAAYYAAVGQFMLPHVGERPLMLRRCPEGIAKTCFYQKHPRPGTPDRLGRVRIREREGEDEYLFVRDVEGLVSLVQMGALEVHVWGARRDKIEQPDRIVFDLDPDPAVRWEDVVGVARRLRELLDALELESFLKTTGGKGLHVVVPIERRHGWGEIQAFAGGLAAGMARERPELLLTVASKAQRKGRIYIDTARNGRGATWVGAYSTRARAGAPVSMPIAWEDLGPKTAPDGFTLPDVARRVARGFRDPWAAMPGVRQHLTAAQLRAAESARRA